MNEKAFFSANIPYLSSSICLLHMNLHPGEAWLPLSPRPVGVCTSKRSCAARGGGKGGRAEISE